MEEVVNIMLQFVLGMDIVITSCSNCTWKSGTTRMGDSNVGQCIC